MYIGIVNNMLWLKLGLGLSLYNVIEVMHNGVCCVVHVITIIL